MPPRTLNLYYIIPNILAIIHAIVIYRMTLNVELTDNLTMHINNITNHATNAKYNIYVSSIFY